MTENKTKKLKHGGWLWLKKAQMPPDCDDIRLGIQRMATELAEQFAAGRELTAAEMILLDRVTQLTGFLKLVERHAWRSGPIQADENGQPRAVPALSSFYIAASNAVVKALGTLTAVAKERREVGDHPALDLKSYLQSKGADSTSK